MHLSSIDLILRLAVAAMLGAVVGVERESASKGAGIRTHSVVALGAALFTVAGAYGFADLNKGPNVDPARIAAQVAAGVGFIGAGAILRHGSSVRGITTAATVWLAAAMGVAVGAGGWIAGLVATVLAVVLLVVLQATKPLTQRFGRRQATLELEYARGHGTLGPLLRSLEDSNSRVLHLSVEDDDRDADGDGVRRVTIDLGLRHHDDIDRIIDGMRSRPEVRAVRLADSENL
jgi:putative Mg2+ transporter-C (MgtC) family protein